MPLVAESGKKQKFTLRGKNLATVKEAKVTGADNAKIKVLGAKTVAVPNNYPGDRVGDSEVEIELELPKDAKPGEVKLIAVNASGAGCHSLIAVNARSISHVSTPLSPRSRRANQLSVPGGWKCPKHRQ